MKIISLSQFDILASIPHGILTEEEKKILRRGICALTSTTFLYEVVKSFPKSRTKLMVMWSDFICSFAKNGNLALAFAKKSLDYKKEVEAYESEHKDDKCAKSRLKKIIKYLPDSRITFTCEKEFAFHDNEQKRMLGINNILEKLSNPGNYTLLLMQGIDLSEPDTEKQKFGHAVLCMNIGNKLYIEDPAMGIIRQDKDKDKRDESFSSLISNLFAEYNVYSFELAKMNIETPLESLDEVEMSDGPSFEATDDDPTCSQKECCLLI